MESEPASQARASGERERWSVGALEREAREMEMLRPRKFMGFLNFEF